MRAGKYKNVRSPRPVEIAHGRVTLLTQDAELYSTIDLALEGQAALIEAVHWNLQGDTILADANDDIYNWFGLLSMDESLANTTINTDQNALLNDEDTITFFNHSFQNVITTSGQTILPVGKSEWQYFQDGILVPESVRLGGVILDGGSAQVVLDCMVYYKRIENPTPAMKDYFYRRR